MTYYFFPLTPEEAADPTKCGARYAFEHRDRWFQTDVLIEVNTYDKGTSHIMYNNKVYNIFKDFVNLNDQYRLYVGKETTRGTDILKEFDQA